MSAPTVIAADALEADSNGGWFAPPEFVRQAALLAALDARIAELQATA